MTRILLIARTEFLAIVRGKAFIVGVLMMPVIVALSIAFQVFAERRVDISERKVAIIDRTGVMYDHLAAAAVAHNAGTARDGVRTGPAFLLEPVAASDATPGETELALSERVRTRDLFAFIEIPASIVDPSLTEQDQVRYYTETPSYTALPQWLRTTLDREAAVRRFAAADVDTALVERLSRPTSLATLGLLSRAPDGTIAAAQRVSQLQTFALPFGLAYLLFIALMSAVPQLLTAVVEEKMSRISEVLISAVSPSQLMAGKLLGVAGVGTLLALIYVGGGIYLALSSGQIGLIQVPLLLWFVLFLIVTMMMFGSIFIAIGAACSDLKDSQSMMQPVIFFLLLPLLASPVVIRAPDAPLAVVLSLIPTFTPFLMLVRLALTPPPPMWQVALSLVLTGLATAGFIWAAGRIFRVGLLMQGKPPNLPELLRWIRQ
jgi:ABC-2 type transport system permease protein